MTICVSPFSLSFYYGSFLKVLTIPLLGGLWVGLVLGMLALMMTPARLALAQGINGVITQTTAIDFGAACPVLPGTVPSPLLTQVSLSNAGGGEIRLAATVEDYFEGSTIDSSRWLTGTTYTWYPVPPAVSGGVLTLDGAYLRSQIGFSQTTPVRFFEARALQRVNNGNAGWPDLGFYRQLPPLTYGEDEPYPNDSALRLFVTRDNNTTFVRGRDGDITSPLIDLDIPTIDLQQYHNFRIEWDSSQTRFYIDGNLQGTIPGVSSLNTWVFLYHQTPTTFGASPMWVDWVRAGVYPASGSYVSCVQDGGQVVNWTGLAAETDAPTGTSVQISTRTSVDGAIWTAWQPVSGAEIASPSGRYLQYRLELATGNELESPEVQAVSITYLEPNEVVVSPHLVELDPDGGQQQFSAQVLDENGREVTNLPPVSWEVVNGGGVINSNGLFTVTNPSAQTYTNSVQARVGNLSGAATVQVRNIAPVAHSGGPYVGAENTLISLTGTGTDVNGGTLSYGWDLDGDGVFDDALVFNPTRSWIDDGVYTIGLRVMDDGGLSDTVTTTVTIFNVAPVINSITYSSGGQVGQPVTVTVQATDTPADTLSYSFDWNNDGIYEIEDQASSEGVTVFTDGGPHQVRVRVRDEDGGEVTDIITIHLSRLFYLPLVFN